MAERAIATAHDAGQTVSRKVNGAFQGRNLASLEGYTKNWNESSALESEEEKQARLTNYLDVIAGYYDGATELYEYGWGKNFHFARYYKGEAFNQALARHEHFLALKMGLKPGMKVLDVGCGVGGPAREIASFAEVQVVGLNNNAFQIARAQKYTEAAGLAHKVSFVKGDFMKLSELFGANSFDAVYAIEATVHAPSFHGVYGEIQKVLKPGGVFGVYEWVMTDQWDPTNPEHKKVAHGIELGNGIPEMRPIKIAREAFKALDYEILFDKDIAPVDDLNAVPWYYPLEGDIRKSQSVWDYATVFRMTWLGKTITQNAVWLLEKARLVPKGTFDIGEALKVAADSLVQGGRKGLFTPMYMVVARKKK